MILNNIKNTNTPLLFNLIRDTAMRWYVLYTTLQKVPPKVVSVCGTGSFCQRHWLLGYKWYMIFMPNDMACICKSLWFASHDIKSCQIKNYTQGVLYSNGWWLVQPWQYCTHRVKKVKKKSYIVHIMSFEVWQWESHKISSQEIADECFVCWTYVAVSFSFYFTHFSIDLDIRKHVLCVCLQLDNGFVFLPWYTTAVYFKSKKILLKCRLSASMQRGLEEYCING